jgi:hypothetical protein
VPVQHVPNVPWGAVSRTFLVYARDAADPTRGKTGLRPDGPGVRAAYVRDGEAPKEVRLTPGRHGTWRAGGFVEVDPGSMPGVYQLGLPDELFAEGTTHAVLLLRFDGALVDPIDIELVAYDPQEPYSIGILELANKNRHAFLHRTMPGLTEETLEASEDTQRRLTTTLRAVHPAGG